MPSLSMVRLVRCSPMLYNPSKLMFTLPGLNARETAYIQLQLDTVQEPGCSHGQADSLAGLAKRVPGLVVTRKTELMVRSQLMVDRVLAIGKAYKVDHSSMAELIKLCEVAIQPGNNSLHRKFNAHQVVRGLELGALMGSTRVWLDMARNNRFDYKKALNALAEKEEFEEKYKSRLLEVMDSLGMSDLAHLVEKGQNEKWNFAEFSEQFYEKVLLEHCGISDMSAIHKYAKGNFPITRSMTLSQDPVTLLRTIHIMQEVLDLDIDMSIPHLAMCGRMSALDMLITLNMLGQSLFMDKEEHVRRKMIISRSARCEQLFKENQQIWSLPISHCVHLLQEIGFTSKEVVQLVLGNSKQGIIGDIMKNMKPYDNNRERFVDVMQKRLCILRKEGVKLGVASSGGTYKFLFNWEKVVSMIDMAEMANNQCFLWFGKQNKVSMVFHPVKQNKMSASRVYLMEYFGIRENDKAKFPEFKKIFDRIPHAKDVPLRIVVESVMYLESLGISKQQIEKGFPIVFYSKGILSEYIPKMEVLVGHDWIQKDNVLCLLNYFIEVEQKFSFDLIYSGIIDAYEQGISDEFFSSLPDNTAEAEPVDTAAQTVPVYSTAKPGQLLTPQAVNTTTASRAFHTSSNMMNKEEGDKTKKVQIFHIQNPFTWLQIFIKFREIKQRWDPNLDQEQFVEGAKYAVEAITNKLESGEWQEVRGLVSRKEFKRLRKEVETEWSDVMRQNASLDVEQMHKVLVTGVRTQQISENKYCDIDVMVLGIKEQEKQAPFVMQVDVRLHREYTQGCLPDWMVTRFRVKNWDKSREEV